MEGRFADEPFGFEVAYESAEECPSGCSEVDE